MLRRPPQRDYPRERGHRTNVQFKNYNDTFGHFAGDALLTRLATKLRDAVAGHGSAYRLGGDEFCARIDLDGDNPTF